MRYKLSNVTETLTISVGVFNTEIKHKSILPADSERPGHF